MASFGIAWAVGWLACGVITASFWWAQDLGEEAEAPCGDQPQVELCGLTLCWPGKGQHASHLQVVLVRPPGKGWVND